MTSKKAVGKRYGITLDSIRSDLEVGRPIWILSAFGPGYADVPVQLMGGLPLEQSPEELRLQYYIAAAAGRGHEAAQAEQQLYSQALQQINNILRDLPGALRYIEAGENQHPNRHDICKLFTGRDAATAAAAVPALAPALVPSLPAAQPLLAGSGQTPNPFAANQPSPFQQPQAGGLNFSNNNTTNKPGFPGAAPAAPAAPANPFNQPVQPAQANPFAAARKPVAGGAAAAGAGAFANPFAPAAPQPAANPFAGAVPQSPAFSSAAAPAAGHPMTFGNNNNNINNFATNAGNPAPIPSSSSSSPFSPSGSSASSVNTDVRTYTTRDARTQRLLTWKGRPVQYMPDDAPCYARRDGGWQRIHFPDGPPPPDPAATELPAEMYDERTKQAYLYLREHGTFKDGWMPLLPPRREWCRFDI